VVTRATVGYSGTPLVNKLGLKPGLLVAVINEPPTLRRDLAPIPAGVSFRDSLRGRLDVVLDTIREVVLPAGLVDTKVCAIDATWSGLKIVWRKERRSA
jgi:hypothetical protein